MVVCSELINQAYIFEKKNLIFIFCVLFLKLEWDFCPLTNVFPARLLQTPTLTSVYVGARNNTTLGKWWSEFCLAPSDLNYFNIQGHKIYEASD